MKYLISALQARPGSVNLTEQEFRQLLADTQVGKPNRTIEDFTESMERIINELRASASAEPFLRPVSRKIAPDYETIIHHPMDLQTLGKNVRSRQYKTKRAFAKDLNLIWSNCLLYNSLESHPIRAQAKLMKQKADHHLEFLVEPEDRTIRATPSEEQSNRDGNSEQRVVLPAQTAGIIEEDSYVPRNCSLLGTPAVATSLSATDLEPPKSDGGGEHSRRRSSLRADILPKTTSVRRVPLVFAAAPSSPKAEMSRNIAKRDRRSSKADYLHTSQGRMTSNLNILLDMRQHHAQLSGHDVSAEHALRLPPSRESKQRADHRAPSELALQGSCVRLEETVCQLLAHAGIEGASASCVRSLVTVAQDYLGHLGRTLRLTIDRMGQEMSPEEIVLHTMHESGDMGVKELDRYLREDIDRLGQKLRDVERRLRQAVQEQPEDEEAPDDDSIDETGLLLNELPGFDDDSLGFLGFSMPSVPRHLLLGKGRKDKSEASAPSAVEEEHPAPPPLLPLMADEITQQIGLLHDLYRQRAQGAAIVKDEPFDPNTSSMTNMGVIVQPKQPSALVKRKGGTAGTDEDGGVKKARRLTESAGKAP